MRTIEVLIGEINIALEAGDWASVAKMVPRLHLMAVQVGDMEFAEVLADLEVIARDAVEYPDLGQALQTQAVVEGVG